MEVQLELEDSRYRKKKGEVWTQAKADERALGMLIEMQLKDEGIAEFVELGREVLGHVEGSGEVDLGVDLGGWR